MPRRTNAQIAADKLAAENAAVLASIRSEYSELYTNGRTAILDQGTEGGDRG